MSQKLQAETHERARVVVGNGWGRGGAIQDQDGHPLSALALITQPMSSQLEGSRHRLTPALRQVLTHAGGEAHHADPRTRSDSRISKYCFI